MGSLNSDGSIIEQNKKVVRHKGDEIVISSIDTDEEIENIDADN